jgi:hypothetical protein
MRVHVQVEGRRLTLRLEPAPDEGTAGAASLAVHELFFEVPSLWRLEDVHPDLVGLVSLLVVQPFTKQRLQLSAPVSAGFAEQVERGFGIEVGPVDHDLDARVVTDGVPGLAFSGGVDSVAALAVLPPATVSVFLDRHTPAERAGRSLYRPEAAHRACEELARRRRRVIRVSTDLEHVREPVGFPVDVSNAAPAVLLADLLHLDSISWGTIAESAYRVGHQRFVDYHRRGVYKSWAAVFAAVGLPVLNPVAGVSEVGTSSIVLQDDWAALAQSCIRGEVGSPCRNCWKCFRKSLLDSALTGVWPDRQEMERLFRVREARMQLSKVPIKHENVVAFSCQRYDGDHPLMLALGRRTRADELPLDHLAHWYPPSAELWPDRHRAEVEANLDRLLGPMDAAGQERFRGWSAEELTAEPTALARAESFGSLLGAVVGAPRAPASYYPSPVPEEVAS